MVSLPNCRRPLLEPADSGARGDPSTGSGEPRAGERYALAVGPLFTLLTDFGAGSGYPAQMKAVLLRAHPDARLVDVSHDAWPTTCSRARCSSRRARPGSTRARSTLRCRSRRRDGTAGALRRRSGGRRFVGRTTGSSRPSSARGRAHSRSRPEPRSRRRAARPSTGATSSRPPPPSWPEGAPPSGSDRRWTFRRGSGLEPSAAPTGSGERRSPRIPSGISSPRSGGGPRRPSGGGGRASRRSECASCAPSVMPRPASSSRIWGAVGAWRSQVRSAAARLGVRGVSVRPVS